jgi:hypothetical protein
MTVMNVTIRWAPDQMRKVFAAIDEGAAPSLDARIASMVRGAGEHGPLELSLPDGQLLMRWCEARRERATEEQPDAIWTRIVAAIHEAVQFAAPAKDRETAPTRPGPPQPSR